MNKTLLAGFAVGVIATAVCMGCVLLVGANVFRTIKPKGKEVELVDWRWYPLSQSGYIEVDGRVKNTSGRTVKSVAVYMVLADSEGNIVSMPSVFAKPGSLRPGEEGVFTTLTPLRGATRVEIGDIGWQWD